MHDFQLEDSFKWARDVAWIGNSCVLYKAGKQTNPYLKDQISFFVLDLKSLKSTSASATLGLSDKEFYGLVSYRYPYAVIKSAPDSEGNPRPEYFLVSPSRTRTKLEVGTAPVVQVLPSNATDNLSAACK